MLRLLFRNLLTRISNGTSNPPTPRLLFASSPRLKSISPVPYSSDHQSLTLSYLTENCGLSSKSASLVSQKIQIRKTENPNSVLALLKSFGFSKTVIAKLITRHPGYLFSNPDKTLKPKLEYFRRIGFSSLLLVGLIDKFPDLLRLSLKRHIIPAIDFLKTIHPTDVNFVAALGRSVWFLQTNVQKTVIPNIEILRKIGVPECKISKVLIIHPRTMMQTPKRLAAAVSMLEGLGVRPLNPMFIYALTSVSAMSRSTWEKKLAVYKSLGWSDEEVVLAFRMQPMFMNKSEEKIRQVTGFIVDKLNLTPKFLSSFPVILCYSFEKRIVPRSMVIEILMSKGLIVRKPFGFSLFVISEKKFFEDFVVKYQEKCPEVLNAYQGKMCSLV